MISIVVASSALPMGPNVTFEMHIRIRTGEMMVIIMVMMRRVMTSDHPYDDDYGDNYHRNTLCITSAA